MSPDPVEQLLERHGEHWRSTFAPPSLEGMLAEATAPAHHRARWVWPLVAAAALLLIPLATVVGVHGSHRTPVSPATHPNASHPVPTATQPRSSRLLGDVDWSSPVLQIDGRTVTVDVDVNRTPNFCLAYGLPSLSGLVAETSTTVTLTAQAFRNLTLPLPQPSPGTAQGCNAVGHLPVPLNFKLSRPLGDRTLIDGATGTRQPVLRASALPAPSYLPPGYVDRGVQWLEHPTHQVRHDYTGPDGQLDLTRGSLFITTPDPLMISRDTVLGHPARVVRANSSPPYGTCVIWSDSEYSWSLCSIAFTAGPAPLDARELLRIGNSMR